MLDVFLNSIIIVNYQRMFLKKHILQVQTAPPPSLEGPIDDSQPEPEPKLLRSASSLRAPNDVLPPICIICKKDKVAAQL
jgi:hypothetical protein